MPIKEFYCTECKTSFEKFYNSIPDYAILKPVCPRCENIDNNSIPDYAILKPVCPRCENIDTREKPSLFNISKTTEKRKGGKVKVAKYILDSVYEVEI